MQKISEGAISKLLYSGEDVAVCKRNREYWRKWETFASATTANNGLGLDDVPSHYGQWVFPRELCNDPYHTLFPKVNESDQQRDIKHVTHLLMATDFLDKDCTRNNGGQVIIAETLCKTTGRS